MHPRSLTQFPLEMVALFLSNNTRLPQKTLTVPSCTNYLPSSCIFYYSDLNNLNSSKRVMMLWERRGHCIGYGWLCAGAPSRLDPGVGEPPALLLGMFLRYLQLNALCALLQCVQEQNTYTEIAVCDLFQVPKLPGKALQAGEAACEVMGGNDQTSAEESPHGAAGTGLLPHHFKLSHRSKSGPEDDRACSKADERVEESMKMHRQSGWRAMWGRSWVYTEECFSREGSGYPPWPVSNDGWRVKASIALTPPWEFPLPPGLFPFCP